MSWIDLSHPLASGMPVYPGDPAVSVEWVAQHETDHLQLSRLALGSHSGTHLDAPRHFIPDGQGIRDLPLDRFYGRAKILSCQNEPGKPLDLRFLQQIDDLPEILLLSTRWEEKWGTDDYFKKVPWFAEGSAKRLIEMGIRMVGADLPTFCEENKAKNPSMMHQTLLGNGVILVENLTGLLPITGNMAEFSAVPLPISNGDGSPVRAMARLIRP